MAARLKECGVRFYASLARMYPPELIAAKVEEWLEEPDLGPGMLVRMIQAGAPIVGKVTPIERMPRLHAVEAGKERLFEEEPEYEEDEEGRWRRVRA